MNECVGPLGFTDMDREGLLIEGFDRKSTMYINYNYPYYKTHLESYPLYEKDNDWLEYRIRIPKETPAKFGKTAKMIESRYNLHVHKFTRRELTSGGMGRKVFEIVDKLDCTEVTCVHTEFAEHAVAQRTADCSQMGTQEL